MPHYIVVLDVQTDLDEVTWWQALELPNPIRWDEELRPDVYAKPLVEEEVARDRG